MFDSYVSLHSPILVSNNSIIMLVSIPSIILTKVIFYYAGIIGLGLLLVLIVLLVLVVASKPTLLLV